MAAMRWVAWFREAQRLLMAERDRSALEDLF
jgi:hypothetical protein